MTVQIGPQGPFLQVEAGPTRAQLACMAARGESAPPPMTLRLMVDTGASHTMLDEAIVAQLGLCSVGALAAHTPTTGGDACVLKLFEVELQIAEGATKGGWTAAELQVGAAPMRAGQGIDGLLGRDVLSHMVVIFNGPARTLTLAG